MANGISRKGMEDKMKNSAKTREGRTGAMSIKNIVTIGMLAAIAVVLMLFEFPIPFIAPSFYEIDLSEVPVLIGTFAMGPLAGVVIELIKILLNLLINGTSTAYVGEFANFVVGCAFLLPAGFLYWHKKTLRNAVLGLVAGSVTMVVIGSLINGLLLLPLYAELFMGGMDNIIAAGQAVNAGIDSVASFVILAVAPFNLIKAVVTSVLTLLLYKRVSNLIHQF